MKASFKTNAKKKTAAKPVAVKKRIVRKGAKAATKKSAYAAYVRDHEKAYSTLSAIETNTLSSVRSIVAKVLAKRGA